MLGYEIMTFCRKFKEQVTELGTYTSSPQHLKLWLRNKGKRKRKKFKKAFFVANG